MPIPVSSYPNAIAANLIDGKSITIPGPTKVSTKPDLRILKDTAYEEITMYTSFVILHNKINNQNYSDVGRVKVDGLNIARSSENLLVSMNDVLICHLP